MQPRASAEEWQKRVERWRENLAARTFPELAVMTDGYAASIARRRVKPQA